MDPVPMRIVHTADWHLGHTLHGHSREAEHERFLGWLLDIIEAERADALLVAGDVFDHSVPTASAERQYFDFLARLRQRCPNTTAVIIAGNHDAPHRIEAPRPLCSALGIHVVGTLRGDAGGTADELAIPIHRDDQCIGVVLAFPFLRRRDLFSFRAGPQRPTGSESSGLGAEELAEYAALFQAAHQSARRAHPEVPIVAMAHCYMTGGARSDDSERPIQLGYQFALSAALFPEDLRYIALGHLHRSQRVDQRDDIRYSGSPIPLSFSEQRYRHQILVADCRPDKPTEVRSHPVPPTRSLIKANLSLADGPDALPTALDALPETAGVDVPLLQLEVEATAPYREVRRQVDAALEGRPLTLAKLIVHRPQAVPRPPEAHRPDLRRLDPEQVFRSCYQATHRGPPSRDILALFHEALEAAEREDAS